MSGPKRTVPRAANRLVRTGIRTQGHQSQEIRIDSVLGLLQPCKSLKLVILDTNLGMRGRVPKSIHNSEDTLQIDVCGVCLRKIAMTQQQVGDTPVLWERCSKTEIHKTVFVWPRPGSKSFKTLRITVGPRIACAARERVAFVAWPRAFATGSRFITSLSKHFLTVAISWMHNAARFTDSCP